MLKWMLKRLGHVLGVREELNRTQLRAHLLFEQLEDRTAPSAALVSDVNFGPGGSAPAFLNGERWFTEIQLPNGQSRVFFVANDGQRGDELWVSDGTPGNATLVRDIQQGAGGSSPRFLTNVNGTLFFAANDGQSGFELWKSDGTSNGTTMVRDIRANGGSDPRFLVNVNGTLFFVANDGQNGFELWRSDGTSNGTAMVANINPGANPSNPHWLLNAGGVLFFVADNGTGNFLFRLDSPSGNYTVFDQPDISYGLNRVARAPQWLAYFPDLEQIFFVATTSPEGYTIWRVGKNSSSGGLRVIKVLTIFGVLPFAIYDPGDQAFFLTPVVDTNNPNRSTRNNILFYRDLDPVFPARRLVAMDIRRIDSNGLLQGSNPRVLDSDGSTPSDGPFDLYNHQGILVYSSGPSRDREPAYVDVRGTNFPSLTAVRLADLNPRGSSLQLPTFFPPASISADLGPRRTWYNWQSNVFGNMWYESIAAKQPDTASFPRGNYSSLGTNFYFAADDGIHGLEPWKGHIKPDSVSQVLAFDQNSQTFKEVTPGAGGSSPRFMLSVPALQMVFFSARGADPTTPQPRNLGDEPWAIVGPPVVTMVITPSVRSPGFPYRWRETLQFTLVFNRSPNQTVLVTGKPRLKIYLGPNIGYVPGQTQTNSRIVYADYVGGSGSRSVTFRYVIQRVVQGPNRRIDRDLDGLEIHDKVDPNGRPVVTADLTLGKITSLFGEEWDGDVFPTSIFPAVSDVTKILDRVKQIIVDALPPWIIQVQGPPPGTYRAGDMLTFTLVTTDPLTVTARPGSPPFLNIRIGNVTRRAYFVGQAAPNKLVFRYKVAAHDYAPNGIYLDPIQPFSHGSYTISGSDIPGMVSTPRRLDEHIQPPVFFRVFVDTRGPRITDIILPGLRNYVTGEVLEFRFQFDEKVYLRGSSSAQPSLRLQIGSAIRQAALVAGLGTNTLTFRYTVQSSDQDLDGIRLLDIALPSGTRLTDLVGNVAPLTFTPPDTRLIRINAPTVRL